MIIDRRQLIIITSTFLLLIATLSATTSTFAQEAPWKFIATGDMGCESDTEDNAAIIQKLNPDLVIVAGDLSYESNLDCWTDIIAPFKDKTKVVLGNHDGKLADEVLSTFGLTSNTYSFDHKNAHFLMLNTQESLAVGSQQFKFAESDLKQSTKEWKFVVYHMPHFTTKSTHSPISGGVEFNKMLAANGVDAVFNGHNHNYQRSFPLDMNANPIQKEVTNGDYKNLDKKAIIYYVSGGGGRDLYSVSSPQPYTAFQKSEFGVLDVDVKGNNLATQFIQSDNTVLDKITVTNENVPPPPPPPDPVCGPNEHLENHVCVPNLPPPPPPGKEICNDGIDNDGDGLIDAADVLDCYSPPPPPPPPEKSQILINNNIQNTTAYGDYKRADYIKYYKVSNMFDNIINDVSYWSQNGKSGFKVILNNPLDKPLCYMDVGVLEPLNQQFNLKLFGAQNQMLLNFDGILGQTNEIIQINNCVQGVKSMSMDFQTPNEQWLIIPEIKLFADTIINPPPKENCFDGIDNDGDGLIDQADILDCPPTVPPPPEPAVTNGTLNIVNGTATINAHNSNFKIIFDMDTNFTAEYKGGEYPVDSPLVIKSEPKLEQQEGGGGDGYE